MVISFPVRLGRRLSEIREKRGLSQTQLADMAGIGRAHLSQIENGAVATRVDTLYALAQAFELTLVEIFKGFWAVVDRGPVGTQNRRLAKQPRG